mmetsp:Transcript_8965/g.14520  ORF Transcript_8965/g.14520 Transcript_8965/m.14520 type:complete len:112 (-) Transcript_8965:657-992(-)
MTRGGQYYYSQTCLEKERPLNMIKAENLFGFEKLVLPMAFCCNQRLEKRDQATTPPPHARHRHIGVARIRCTSASTTSRHAMAAICFAPGSFCAVCPGSAGCWRYWVFPAS